MWFEIFKLWLNSVVFNCNICSPPEKRKKQMLQTLALACLSIFAILERRIAIDPEKLIATILDVLHKKPESSKVGSCSGSDQSSV